MRDLTDKDFWHGNNTDKLELREEARKFFGDIFRKYRCERDRHSRDIELALMDVLHSEASMNRGLEKRNRGE